MKHQILVALLLVFPSLLHCSVETDDGEVNDTRSNWLKSCDSDAECGDVLSCHCGVCTISCTEDAQCADLDADAVCGGSAACASGEGICLSGNESSGSGGTGGESLGTGGRSSTGGTGEGPAGGMAGAESSGGDGGADSCLAEGQECRRVELGTITFEADCCSGASCTQLELSDSTTDAYSCKRDFTPCPDNCQVQQATENCTSGETFKIVWSCGDGNAPADVLSDCVDMATGLPRWCCPETTLPHCVPTP